MFKVYSSQLHPGSWSYMLGCFDYVMRKYPRSLLLSCFFIFSIRGVLSRMTFVIWDLFTPIWSTFGLTPFTMDKGDFLGHFLLVKPLTLSSCIILYYLSNNSHCFCQIFIQSIGPTSILIELIPPIVPS